MRETLPLTKLSALKVANEKHQLKLCIYAIKLYFVGLIIFNIWFQCPNFIIHMAEYTKLFNEWTGTYTGGNLDAKSSKLEGNLKGEPEQSSSTGMY